MQEIIKKAILNLELSEIDAEIYLIILFSKKEKPNVLQLSKQLNIYRQKVIESLEKLQEKGLIEIGPRQKILLTNPKKISSILKFQQVEIQKASSNFNDILPDLLSNFYITETKPTLKVFEGRNQFINLFNQVLEDSPANSEILFLGEGEDFYNIIPFEYFRVWGKERIKKGIKAKVLARSLNSKISEIQNLNQNELREIKFLPAKFNSLGCVFVYNNNVVNWNTSELKAVLIQDNQISIFYKNLFSLIWDFC